MDARPGGIFHTECAVVSVLFQLFQEGTQRDDARAGGDAADALAVLAAFAGERAAHHILHVDPADPVLQQFMNVQRGHP